MWGNTKSKAKTNKILTLLKPTRSKLSVRRTNKGQVSKLVRDGYGSKSDWYALCKQVKERDRYCCVKCGVPEVPKEDVYHEVHHMRPLSKGGVTALANLILICKVCHSKRHKHMR